MWLLKLVNFEFFFLQLLLEQSIEGVLYSGTTSTGVNQRIVSKLTRNRENHVTPSPSDVDILKGMWFGFVITTVVVVPLSVGSKITSKYSLITTYFYYIFFLIWLGTVSVLCHISSGVIFTQKSIYKMSHLRLLVISLLLLLGGPSNENVLPTLSASNPRNNLQWLKKGNFSYILAKNFLASR